MKYLLIYICLFGIISLSISAWANSSSDSLMVYELGDTVVVVANRYEIPLKYETRTLTSINAVDIEAYATHSVLELVDMYVPSAFILDKKIMGYGVGSAGGGLVQLRGQGGQPNTGVLMLINGHPDFMGIFGHPLPDVYGMNDVSRVEIISGPASTVFGSNALGGVINLVSRPTYQNRLNISMRGGSYDTYNATIQLSYQKEKHGIFLTASRNSSSGHIDQTEFHSYHLQGGWEYRLNSKLQLTIQGRYVPYDFDDPSRGSDPVELGTYGKIKRGMGEIILKNEAKNLKGSTQIYTNMGHHEFFDGFKSDDFSYGISTYQQFNLNNRFSIAAGSDLLHYGGETNVDNRSYDLTSFGAYLLALYNPTALINFKTGIRYQYNSLKLNTFAPTAGVSIIPYYSLKLYANIQSGFRYPTIQELYLFPPSNPDLEEERVLGFDGGIVHIINSRTSIKFAYFQNKSQDMISLVANPSSPPPVKFQNSGEANQWGIESQLNIELNQHAKGQLSYSYLEPDQLTAFNPKQQLKYLIRFSWHKFSAAIYGRYVHNLFADNMKRLPLPDYHVFNLACNFNLNSLGFHVKFLNLLDRDYLVLPDYPAPGFHVLAGIDYSL